jgi:hypothetical protein
MGGRAVDSFLPAGAGKPPEIESGLQEQPIHHQNHYRDILQPFNRDLKKKKLFLL